MARLAHVGHEDREGSAEKRREEDPEFAEIELPWYKGSAMIGTRTESCSASTGALRRATLRYYLYWRFT